MNWKCELWKYGKEKKIAASISCSFLLDKLNQKEN